jgi:Cof subfamily protein (haloacid dehalogenase superfamily)
MDCKMVFFDVDGTLTSHEDGRIPEDTRAAIRALQRNGIKVGAATGRPLSMCRELSQLGIDTVITANGGYAKHKDEVIHKLPMKLDYLRDVFEFAQMQNHGLSFYTEDFCMNGVQDAEILRALKETLFLSEYPAVNPLIYTEEVYLMCLYGTDDMASTYIEKFPHLSFRRWHPYVLSVLQEEVSKSVAILKVIRHLGIAASEVVAFGDGENDIDMLDMAGLGIAMGNAGDRLKQSADFVTRSSSEGGIEYALKKYGII